MNELLPQATSCSSQRPGTGPYALVTEERFCGPHSLVKDIYVLDFAFIRPGSTDHFKAEVRRIEDRLL